MLSGGIQRRRGSSEESLTGGDVDNDRHSLSVGSDDRAMMQLQRVASTTTVMMAMTTASTPGDSESDNGLLGSATTFASDVRRFSVPSHDHNQVHHQHLQHQLNNCGGSLEHRIQHPTSSVSILRQQQQNPYHSEHTQESTVNNSLINQQGVIGQSDSSVGMKQCFYALILNSNLSLWENYVIDIFITNISKEY